MCSITLQHSTVRDTGLCQGVPSFLKYSSNVCDEPVPWELSTLESLLENIGEYKGNFVGYLSKHLWRDSRSGPSAMFICIKLPEQHGGDSAGTQGW